MSCDPSGKTVTTGESGQPRAASEDSEELPLGTIVDAYAIEGKIAAGGGGTVYSARHITSQEPAAVKVLNAELASSPTAVARFLREANLANTLKHPNIVNIFEFGHLPDGRPYMVMELLGGSNLRKYMVKRGRLTPAEVEQVLEPVCSALSAAHAQGVIHRDLTESNINVEMTEQGLKVKLLDFGVAKLLYPEPGTEKLTALGTVLGTIHAMAPEQVRGEAVDTRCDIYALGVLTYQLLTAHRPFSGKTKHEVMRMTLDTPAPRASESARVSPAIDEVILRCMKKRPEQRYDTVELFLAAYKEAVRNTGATTMAQATTGLAVLVELQVDAEGEGDDGALDDCADVLDLVEQSMIANGLAMPIQTSSTILGVKLLPSEPTQHALARSGVQALAESLVDALTHRPSRHPTVHVKIATYQAQAEVNGAGEVSGGAIVDVAAAEPSFTVTV